MTARTFSIALRGRRFAVTVDDEKRHDAAESAIVRAVLAMLARLETTPPIAEAAE